MFLLTEVECRADQRGVKVAVWQVEELIDGKREVEPELGPRKERRRSARQTCRYRCSRM